jgi:AraC-like DNA-binding protein
MCPSATIRTPPRPRHDPSLQKHDFSLQTPMPSQSVVAVAVTALLDFAVSEGAPRPLLMERARLADDVLGDPDGRVPFACYVELMKAGQELSGDPALALHFGEAVDVSEIAIGCVAAGMSATFEECFVAMNRYARLGVDVYTSDGGDRFGLERGEGRLWMVDRRANPNAFPELTESTLARIVCSTRRSLGHMSLFKAVSFTHAAPHYRQEYERIFQIPVMFGARRNGVSLDDRVLGRHRRSRVPSTVVRAIRSRADGLLRDLDAQKTFRGRIEHLLTSALPSGEAKVGAIADQLAVSRHTLLRRLKAEGVTFDEVLDGLRRRMAAQLLEGGASVMQTAHRLGYSDPASFSRAFKRWTGVAPSRFAGSKIPLSAFGEDHE